MFCHAFALNVGFDLIRLLNNSCEQIELVGSIRRMKTAVNDVDILAIPRFAETRDRTLFGEPVGANLLDRRLAELCSSSGEFVLDSDEGKAKRLLRTVRGKTIAVDIAVTAGSAWWTALLIRTGSREHNLRLAQRAAELRMRLKFDGTGLVSPGGCLVPVASEEDIFRHLKLPYREPHERS
jgi:DNA polymerase/3'-5' exonuclease PolX